MLAAFGIAALILAAIGLYAVMGAYVRQRDTEIGIRVALGATAADVRRLVVGEGLWLAGLGAVIGLGGVVVTTRLLRGLLFGVHPLDAVSIWRRFCWSWAHRHWRPIYPRREPRVSIPSLCSGPVDGSHCR